MKPNVWASLIFSVLVVALMTAHIVKNSGQVDELDAGLLLVAFIPWFWVIVKSIKIAGIEVEFRELKDAVERQDGEIRALQFVVAHFLPDAELRVLSRFAEAGTYTLASDDHEFFTATGPLRGLGFIEPIPENWTEDFNTDNDLKTLFRLTDRGREYLELRTKSESFTP